MNLSAPNLTPPIIRRDGQIWFSAYGFGWGYRAFALTAEIACKELGAANETHSQLLLAFELGRRRLAHAVEEVQTSENGERIILSLKQS